MINNNKHVNTYRLFFVAVLVIQSNRCYNNQLHGCVSALDAHLASVWVFRLNHAHMNDSHSLLEASVSTSVMTKMELARVIQYHPGDGIYFLLRRQSSLFRTAPDSQPLDWEQNTLTLWELL